MANRPLGRSTFYRGMSAPHDQNSSKDKNHSGDDKAREYKKEMEDSDGRRYHA
jgi:hypothetical protein